MLKAQQQADIILRPGSQNTSQNCLASELNHLAERIFTHPTGWSDKVISISFCFRSRIFDWQTECPKPISGAGLLSILSMNSVRLGQSDIDCTAGRGDGRCFTFTDDL